MRSSSLRCAALAVAMLAAPTGVAHADVAPPPTLIVDFLWLGLPWGPVVGLALLVVAVFLYRQMRRSGRSRKRAVAVTVVLFAAANLACYVWGQSHRRRSYPRPLPDVGRADGGREQGNLR